MVDCQRVQSGSPRQNKLSWTPINKTYDHLLYVHPSNSKTISTVNPCVRQAPCPPKTSYLTRKNQYGPLGHLLEDWYWNGSHIMPLCLCYGGMKVHWPVIFLYSCPLQNLWSMPSPALRFGSFGSDWANANAPVIFMAKMMRQIWWWSTLWGDYYILAINATPYLSFAGAHCGIEYIYISCERTPLKCIWYSRWQSQTYCVSTWKLSLLALNISTSADYTIRYCIYSSIFTKRQVTPLLPSNSSYSIYHCF